MSGDVYVTVCLTRCFALRTGQIGYALAPAIASGQMFGDGQPVILQLFDISSAADSLQGLRLGKGVFKPDYCQETGMHGIIPHACGVELHTVAKRCLRVCNRSWPSVYPSNR
jgi:hypothetical protein